MSNNYFTDQMKKAFWNYLSSNQGYTLNLFEISIISVPQFHISFTSTNSDFVEPMLSIAHSCLNRKRSARAHSLTTCPRSGGSSDYIDKFQRLFSAKWIEDKYYIKDI